MNRRSGATLVEVLVAMFVMAIGLLSLLALFPVGAFRMAQAIRDTRCADAAHNALALATAFDIRADTKLIDPTTTPVTDVFYDPNPANTPIPQQLPKANPNGPSYPVYIDPLGFGTFGVLTPNWVGNTIPAPRAIPRRNLSFTTTLATSLQFCSILDDVTFTNNALPALNANRVQRENRFTWAYLARRPRTAAQDVVDLTVVVYENRPLAASGLTPAEFEYSGIDPTSGGLRIPYATYDLTRNVVKVRWRVDLGHPKPQVRPGTWILDATTETYRVGVGANQKIYGSAHGNFYQVVAVEEVTDIDNRPAIEVQVEPPLREFAGSYLQPLPSPPFPANTWPNPTSNANVGGRVIIMDNVAAVFRVGTGWGMTTRSLAMPAGSGGGF